MGWLLRGNELQSIAAKTLVKPWGPKQLLGTSCSLLLTSASPRLPASVTVPRSSQATNPKPALSQPSLVFLPQSHATVSKSYPNPPLNAPSNLLPPLFPLHNPCFRLLSELPWATARIPSRPPYLPIYSPLDSQWIFPKHDSQHGMFRPENPWSDIHPCPCRSWQLSQNVWQMWNYFQQHVDRYLFIVMILYLFSCVMTKKYHNVIGFVA